MTGARRVPNAGLLAGAPVVGFSFDGRPYTGVAGESLAAALIASGERVVARSFKYHRPRGVVGIGNEDPAALVTLARPTGDEPNLRATMVELYDGLAARGQNAWPSVRFDATTVTGFLSPLFPAGFYYKTFMGPAGAWPFYERVIRRIAGLGEVPATADQERYTSTHAHADLLVAGGGVTGLQAALVAGRAGARVVLADENPWFGLGALGDAATIDGRPAWEWSQAAVDELSGLETVTLLNRSIVAGRYEHGFAVLCQKLRDAPAAVDSAAPRFKLWKLRVAQTIVATGALDRPSVFANNDRPGVMTVSAAAGYLDRYGVLVGSRIVIAAGDDAAHAVAARLVCAGAEVTVLDCRDGGSAAASDAGASVEWRSRAVNVAGRSTVRSIRAEGPNGERWVDAEILAVRDGWSPTLHLYAQTGGKAVWDEARTMFVPGAAEAGAVTVGACNGTFGLQDGLAEATAAAAALCADLGLSTATGGPAVEGDTGLPATARGGPGPRDRKRCFVDVQNDVTLADLDLAVREGYRSIEHVKRYTTLGMGTDQGKLGNVNGVRAIAEARGEAVSDVGTTRFRPPTVPLPMGAVAAHLSPEQHHPMRRTAVHHLHEEAGCVWLNAGAWLRPQFYRRGSETDLEAVNREVMAVRENVGLVDVSTLGKIEIAGPDVVPLLNRVYTNGWSTLKVGMGRYGIMLREDGMVFDDGVTTRIAEQHYVMSTTSSGAGTVYEWLTWLLETRWRDLRVALAPVTEQWFAVAVAGPKARDVLARVAEDFDVSNEAFPFMGARVGRVAGIPARVNRISFSGELSYEINVPADRGAELWSALLEAGSPEAMAPYGVESMGVLRLEKGHFVIGREAEGRTNPYDIGLGRMVSGKKWFIGKEALELPEMQNPRRRQVVGVVPVDKRERLPRSAHLVMPERPDEIGGSQGWIASMAWSPMFDHDIALALVEGGHGRIGERLAAYSPIDGHRVAVDLVSPHFYDPDGGRQSG
jgi:sarcosine oxidase subunit alpha